MSEAICPKKERTLFIPTSPFNQAQESIITFLFKTFCLFSNIYKVPVFYHLLTFLRSYILIITIRIIIFIAIVVISVCFFLYTHPCETLKTYLQTIPY